MNRSKNLTLVICSVVLAVACSDKSEPKSGSKSPRKHSSTAGAHAGAGGRDAGETDATDATDAAAAAADGGDGAVADSGAAAADAADHDGSEPSHEGAAGMSAVNGDPGAVDRGPYYASDSWEGYLWISEHGQGSTIAPTTDFAAPAFDTKVCVQGSVVPTPDSSGNAILGMNINQERRVDAPTLTLVPSHDGLQVDVTNAAGSPLRIQVHALDGATNGMSRWCAMLSGSGGFIPWTRFNTACWDGSGNAYKREPIASAMLLVPGNTDSAVPYDFCLLRLAEADGPPDPDPDADAGI